MRTRSVSIVLLLLTAGAIIAPAVHRAHHAAEAAAVRAQHAAAGHHHHDAFGEHGVELTPACDRAVPLHELACVLCKGLSAGVASAAPMVIAPARRDRPEPAAGAATLARLAGASRVRGPPLTVV